MLRKVELMNLTGHPLSITDREGRRISLDAIGKARVRGRLQTVEFVEVQGGAVIPVLESEEKTIIELPAPADGVIYVVSGIVAARAMRDDVMSPSRISRDGNGRAKSARALMKIKPRGSEA